MHSWYVVFCHPREEAVARDNLERQGFSTYLPRYRKVVSHARKITNVAASLFPRYLFVKLNIDDPRWRVVRSTRGVVDLVRQGGDPVTLSDVVIADIRRREDDEGYVLLARQVELREGQAIRLRHRAFAGHDAVFKAAKDSDRVVVLLSLLGREFSVEAPIEAVRPAMV